MKFDVLHGDCLDVMQTLPASSVDAVVTDPPYGLAFMGKHWDHGVPGVDFWVEALRVAKPGAHLLAFGGTRTYHRLAVAIEDAGWEIRDCVMWVYGSGFPKSHDVSKAIDKAAGAEREVIGRKTGRAATPVQDIRSGSYAGGNGENSAMDCSAITAPATDLARQWDGWGTALKPAVEPIIMARKPLIGTVAQNVAVWGTGAINVDACRVGTNSTARKDPQNGNLVNAHMEMRPWMQKRIEAGKPLKGDFAGDIGRWPANLIHDGSDEVLAGFPVTTPSKAANGVKRFGRSAGIMGNSGALRDGRPEGHDDTGGSAARYFYCAKASKADRDAGCEGLAATTTLIGAEGHKINPMTGRPVVDLPRRNHHPTVKPTALMRYLVRLVTPPDGAVLDPFTGSGSTGKAAMLESVNFIGIEREAEYVELARARIQHALDNREAMLL